MEKFEQAFTDEYVNRLHDVDSFLSLLDEIERQRAEIEDAECRANVDSNRIGYERACKYVEYLEEEIERQRDLIERARVLIDEDPAYYEWKIREQWLKDAGGEVKG